MSRHLLRYILVGGLGAAIHIAVLTAFVEIAKFEPVFASIVGFLVSLTCSYWLHAIWSFDTAQQQHRKASVRYVVVSVMGLCLNTLIMFLLINGFGLWYLIAQAIAAVLVPIHNFLLNFYWTFEH